MLSWHPIVVILLQLTIGLCRGEATPENDLFTSTDIRTIVANLARQVQLQQFALEERTRADGGSGIKQQRTSVVGSRPYNTQTHTGFQIAAAHDHANNRNTVGLGESIFVMNGVEFRTRHNDYPLYMAHPTSSEYNTVKEIPFPEVPPEVTEKETISEQVDEMREWFRAWADQVYTERDYRPYFKPILCYLEAGWTAQSNKLEEAFTSDRHFIDADSWLDLNEKVRYNAYMGRKDNQENLAFLPRTIINITESGLPVYAQWNYRILCHPLKQDLPTGLLAREDDLQARLLFKKTLHDFSMMRGARYRIEGENEGTASLTLLDDLMHEIPGRDNYQGYLTETSLGDVYTDARLNNGSLLNTAYFHRRYNFGQKDASGSTKGKLGFSDPNLFVAETTQTKIAPIHVRVCEAKGGKQCHETKKRVTYAIPLEIIYLTPLHKWNPHDIDFADNAQSSEMTDSGRRNGGFTEDTAFAASGQNLYYRTPAELFVAGDVEQADAADTAIPVVGMLDVDGNVRSVTASGIRIFLPEIEGVGVLRTRYPIMPVHGEASPVWKELNALKDIVMNLQSHHKYLYKSLPGLTTSCSSSSSSSSGDSSSTSKPIPRTVLYVTFGMEPSTEDGHFHIVNITGTQRTQIMEGKTVRVRSSEVEGHTHSIMMAIDVGRFYIVQADGQVPPTTDGHSETLQWRTIVYTDGTVTVRGRASGRMDDDPLFQEP